MRSHHAVRRLSVRRGLRARRALRERERERPTDREIDRQEKEVVGGRWQFRHSEKRKTESSRISAKSTSGEK